MDLSLIHISAAQLEEDLRNELDYLSHEPAANDALNKIRLIVAVQGGFSYKKIPELNSLMATVREGHARLLDDKRAEVGDMITQCMGAVHQAANGDPKADDLLARADEFYTQQKQKVRDYQSLALLDGLIPPMLQYKDDALERIETCLLYTSSGMIETLSEEHKEVLYFLSLRLYSTTRLAAIRGQSDRNIRKLRKTIHKKLQRQMYDHLCSKPKSGLTLRERRFLEEYSVIAKKQGKDAVIRRENKTKRRKKKNRP